MKTAKLIIFLILSFHAFGQDFVEGERYFGAHNYIEYIHGNLPIILSAPHGGELKPEGIEDRNCTGCVYINDAFTQELCREIATEITEITGCFPNVILNRLHRSKLDMNRDLIEGADGDPFAEQAWMDYQHFINVSRDSIYDALGKGIFIDLHGHGHEIQRLELGYLLSKSDLQLDASELDGQQFLDKSSLRSLAASNLMSLSFEELIRGDKSFGSLIADENYPAVPSLDNPRPEQSEPYFSGGYNTLNYGSKNSGTIDAIQIECNQDVRFEANSRKAFAKKIAKVILEYLDLHYFDSKEYLACSQVSTSNPISSQLSFYPNPFVNKITVPQVIDGDQVIIYDQNGSVVFQKIISNNQTNLSLDILESGLYNVVILSINQSTKYARILKLLY